MPCSTDERVVPARESDQYGSTLLSSFYSNAVMQTAMPVVVGAKYDLFLSNKTEVQQRVITQACSFAKLIEAPLVFTSIVQNIHVSKVYQERASTRCLHA